MEILRFRIKGDTPLMMHNNVACDPLHPLAKQMKKISSVRNKTDEHHEEIAYIEYQAGIYHDPKIGPYIPGRCVDALLREAAKFSKKGKTVTRALQTVEDKVKLLYDGPRDIQGLYSKCYRDRRPVTVNRSTVIRTRPFFEEWAAEFQVAIDPSQLDAIEVRNFLEVGGRLVGLCDYRPTYGKFNLEAAV